MAVQLGVRRSTQTPVIHDKDPSIQTQSSMTRIHPDLARLPEFSHSAAIPFRFQILKCSKLTTSKRDMSIYCTVACSRQTRLTGTFVSRQGKDVAFLWNNSAIFHGVPFDQDVHITVRGGGDLTPFIL